MVQLLGGDPFPFLEDTTLETIQSILNELDRFDMEAIESSYEDNSYAYLTALTINVCIAQIKELLRLHRLLVDLTLSLPDKLEKLYHLLPYDWTDFPFQVNKPEPYVKPIFRQDVTSEELYNYMISAYVGYITQINHLYTEAYELLYICQENNELSEPIHAEFSAKLQGIHSIMQFTDAIDMELFLRDPDPAIQELIELVDQDEMEL